MSIKRMLAGTAILLGAALPGTAAHAVPYAFASNQISGLIFSTPSGSTFTPSVTSQTISDSASFGAIAVNNPSQTSTIGTSLNIAAACAGANTCPENTFVPASGPTLTSGTRSDSQILGFANPAVPGPVSLNNVAEGRGTSLGTSTANNTGSITFSIVGTGSALSLSLSDTIQLIASSLANGETATAQITNTFRVFDAGGATVAIFTPVDLNTQAGSANGVPGTASIGPTTISTTLTTPVLIAGANYNISLTSSSAESITPGGVTPIPEPTMLGVLGIGMLAIGAYRQRKRG
jgi:hypothetical protein